MVASLCASAQHLSMVIQCGLTQLKGTSHARGFARATGRRFACFVRPHMLVMPTICAPYREIS